MREGRPSLTAIFVACARGVAGRDPIAARLVPPRLARFAQPTGWRRWIWGPPLVNLMRLRTIALDEAVIEGVARGTRQVVVLGAGLCARAFRMSELSESIVFEVDHPATQTYKRKRLEGIQPTARDVRFLPVDFEKDDLAVELAKAGHDRTAPTTWLWEGVTPYLTPAAIAHTLAAIRALSPDGSTLAVTYYEPAAGNAPGERRRRFMDRWLSFALPLIGEPFHGRMSSKEMIRLLATHGFTTKSDSTYPDLAARLSLPVPRPGASERVLIATATHAPSM
jgi:methyltransferase (TIGR00027 family)